MKTLEESVVHISMDGSDKELFNYLPYILQDSWELGADPDVIVRLIRKNFDIYSQLQILDLGCGKGAVSIKVSSTFGCRCFGIDAIPAFIDFAKHKAAEYKVDDKCFFEVGDIREMVSRLSGYDIIILGALGPVFGDYIETLTTLSKCISKSGAIIIDDGYIDDGIDYSHPLIRKHSVILNEIDKAGMKVIDNEILQHDSIKEADDTIFEKIKRRCFELMEMHPDKKQLFLDYIARQIEENDVLENKVVCAVMVIKGR